MQRQLHFGCIMHFPTLLLTDRRTWSLRPFYGITSKLLGKFASFVQPIPAARNDQRTEIPRSCRPRGVHASASYKVQAHPEAGHSTGTCRPKQTTYD